MAAEKGDYKREIKGAVIATVVGGSITAIAAYLAPGGFGEALTWPSKAWQWFGTVAGAMAGHFGRSTPTPNWLLYTLVLAALVAVAMLGVLAVVAISARSWRAYVEDIFDGVRWRWAYVADSVSSLRAYCSQCDANLVAIHDNDFRVTLHCEHCRVQRLGWRGSLSDLEGTIKRRVNRIIRTEEWRTHI